MKLLRTPIHNKCTVPLHLKFPGSFGTNLLRVATSGFMNGTPSWFTHIYWQRAYVKISQSFSSFLLNFSIPSLTVFVFTVSYLYGMFTRIILVWLFFVTMFEMFWKANVDLLIARSFVPLQIIKTSSRFNFFISWLGVSSNWLEFDPGFRTLSFKDTAYKVF